MVALEWQMKLYLISILISCIKQESILNCDETMVNIDRRTGKVVVPRRTKQAYSESKWTRDHIIVNACLCASGQVLPPHIIFTSPYPSGPYACEDPDGGLSI